MKKEIGLSLILLVSIILCVMALFGDEWKTESVVHEEYTYGPPGSFRPEYVMTTMCGLDRCVRESIITENGTIFEPFPSNWVLSHSDLCGIGQEGACDEWVNIGFIAKTGLWIGVVCASISLLSFLLPIFNVTTLDIIPPIFRNGLRRILKRIWVGGISMLFGALYWMNSTAGELSSLWPNTTFEMESGISFWMAISAGLIVLLVMGIEQYGSLRKNRSEITQCLILALSILLATTAISGESWETGEEVWGDSNQWREDFNISLTGFEFNRNFEGEETVKFSDFLVPENSPTVCPDEFREIEGIVRWGSSLLTSDEYPACQYRTAGEYAQYALWGGIIVAGIAIMSGFQWMDRIPERVRFGIEYAPGILMLTGVILWSILIPDVADTHHFNHAVYLIEDRSYGIHFKMAIVAGTAALISPAINLIISRKNDGVEEE